MTRTKNDCGGSDHRVHRRLFLQGTAAAGAASAASFSGLFSIPALADKVKKQAKRCILLWLCGGPSQFETWFVSTTHDEAAIAQTVEAAVEAMSVLA